MTKLTETISGLLDSQFPEFIVNNNPKFVDFLRTYYQWLEDSNQGAVLYQTKNLLNYKDIDTTSDEYVQYFINDFLPYFPQTVAVDQRKLIKAIKYFYITKGSLNSLVFLFRVLYDIDSEVYFPKENILKASDGKWQIPQSLKLVLSPANEGFDVSNLNMREGIGSISNAICTIESAYRTIDPVLGIQIVEVFVSNIVRSFVAEENLIVNGTYTSNNNPFTFEEKIIGSISGLKIDPKNQGLKYNGTTYHNDGSINYPGDPVVFYGGLADTTTAKKAIAYVNNVSVGSISSVSVENGGFGYTKYPNTITTVIGGQGVGANVVVQSVDLTGSLVINSDSIFNYQNVVVEYVSNVYTLNLTTGSGNTTSTVNLNTTNFVANTTITNFYDNYVLQVMQGTGSSASPNIALIKSYNPTTQIATLAPPYLGSSIDGTSNIKLYAVQDYGFANTAFKMNNLIGMGNTVSSINLYNLTSPPSGVSGSYVNSILEYVGGTGTGTIALITDYNGTTQIANIIQMPGTTPIVAADGTTNVAIYYSNANTKLSSAFSFFTLPVGNITAMNVISGGYGFQSVPTISLNSTYGTDYSNTLYQVYINAPTSDNYNAYVSSLQSISDVGEIANVTVINGGTGYNSGSDTIIINSEQGYGATFSFTTNATGSITSVSVVNPGEGYSSPVTQTATVTVNSATGVGAQLVAYGYGEGAVLSVSVSDIGRISDFRLVSRGFDYQSTPNVSLRIIDVPLTINVHSNNIVGAGNTTSTVNLHSLSFTPSTIENFYVGATLKIIDGTGKLATPNSAKITGYSSATGIAYLASPYLGTVPDGTSNVVIYGANVDFSSLSLTEGDFVYQGKDPGNTTFSAFFDLFGSNYSGLLSNSSIRLYEYSGSLIGTQDLVFANASINVTPVVSNTTVYGNGQARANAIFLNGLIQYPGYYINTDGQPSADQYLQSNTRYHNYSYVVQSEKSINDYEETLRNILHPAGMELLSDMVIFDTQSTPVQLSQNLSTYNVYSGETVTANSYWANASLVGTSTTFNANAKVGDLIVIGKGTSREQTKVIEGIINDTLLTMESNTRFLGPGYLQTISYGSSNYTISKFNSTSNANTVNLNTSNFVANNTINNIYNNSTIEVTNGSGFISNTINLTAGSGNTTTSVNLNTTNFVANSTIANYYQNYFLQVVDGTGSTASPNVAIISAYNATNKIATLSTALGATLDGTSNVVIYAPNTFLITTYYAANQVAVLNVATYVPLDSTSEIILNVPISSNTFTLPNTVNIYGVIQAGDGISFDLGIAETPFNANVTYVDPSGLYLTVDTPQTSITTPNTKASYYVYPILNSQQFTILNNQG
jgi:hypothetical protein